MAAAARLPRSATTYRAAAALAIGALLLPGVVSALAYTPGSLHAGTVERPASGTTVISTQGFGAGDGSDDAKPARLVGVGRNGGVEWVHTGADHGVVWFYDVDPLADGTVLVTAGRPEGTVVYAWDPRTDETVWTERFDMEDTHDVDLINGDQLLIAQMRNYDDATGRNDDRLVVYDRSTDRIVWAWRFENAYDRGDGGRYGDDWTHVNDVDKVGPGRYMASPRNMDEVIVVNRSTGEVETRLGSDGNHSVLYAQHSPQSLVGENGTPTVLVADSENDRVVEYARTEAGWTRTWTLGSGDSLDWPRDADRLPNGNTLVVDTLNHRVIEVTPTGEVVWEFYATWGPYDAERIALGNEPEGPTARESNATGRHELAGGAGTGPGSGTGAGFSRRVAGAFAGTPVGPEARWVAARWAHATPWVRPVWMGSRAFAAAVGAALVALLWGGAEVAWRRDRIAAAARQARARVRQGE